MIFKNNLYVRTEFTAHAGLYLNYRGLEGSNFMEKFRIYFLIWNFFKERISSPC